MDADDSDEMEMVDEGAAAEGSGVDNGEMWDEDVNEEEEEEEDIDVDEEEMMIMVRMTRHIQ